MKKTAVVFGATGLVGNELVNELLDNNEFEKVISIVRRTKPVSNPKHKQVLLQDFSSLLLRKDELIATDYYCCIGTTIKIAGSQEAFRRVDFDIPQQIALLAQELGISNLVVISSIGANANTRNFYLRTKGEMENAVRAIYRGNLKIVRPSLLMGNRNEFRFAEKASAMFMKMLNWIFIGPAKKYRGIYASDVAKAMIKATGLPAGKVFLESNELQALAVKR